MKLKIDLETMSHKKSDLEWFEGKLEGKHVGYVSIELKYTPIVQNLNLTQDSFKKNNSKQEIKVQADSKIDTNSLLNSVINKSILEEDDLNNSSIFDSVIDGKF